MNWANRLSPFHDEQKVGRRN